MANIWFDNIMTKLINKDVKRYERETQPSSQRQKSTPCITVSREAGSGGRLVAQMVAKKLQMRFYDREFVEMISRDAKKRKSVVATLDEKSLNLIEEVIASLATPRDKLSEMSYFKYLCRTILSLTEKGGIVILGRGANFIIPPDKCLRVSIIAPLRTRIANTVKYEKKSLETATSHIRRVHFARKDFVKRYFNKNISNANYYDLVLNTEHLSLEQAVAIIIKAFREKFLK